MASPATVPGTTGIRRDTVQLVAKVTVAVSTGIHACGDQASPPRSASTWESSIRMPAPVMKPATTG